MVDLKGRIESGDTGVDELVNTGRRRLVRIVDPLHLALPERDEERWYVT
jgi:hypothetical protein